MKNEKIKNLIGIFMILPIYIIITVMLSITSAPTIILMPILMYLPILIGIILSLACLDKKPSKILISIVIFLLLTSSCFYCSTYFGEYSGFDGIGIFLMWILSSIVLRIFSIIFCGKTIGIKKTLIYAVIYIIMIVSALLLGFWE